MINYLLIHMDLSLPVINKMKESSNQGISDVQYNLKIVKIKNEKTGKKYPNLLLSDGQSTIKARLSNKKHIQYHELDVIKIKKFITKAYKSNKMYICIKDCEVLQFKEPNTLENSSLNSKSIEEKKLPLNNALLSQEVSNEHT